jgi:hypothetical protein
MFGTSNASRHAAIFSSRYCFHENTGVTADREELESLQEIVRSFIRFGYENALSFSFCADSRAGVGDHRVNFRIPPISEVPAVGRTIAGSNKDTVNTFNRSDGFDLVDGGLRLDLNQHTDIFVSLSVIVMNRPISICRGATQTPSRFTERWITRRGDRSFGVFGALNERH